MYNDNYLIFDDVMELEEAGLDVDELADMDWDDRYDAIDEAGLNPMDYEYGFLDDDYSGSASSGSKTENHHVQNAPIIRSNATKTRAPKMSRKEKRSLRKAHDELETTLDALLGMRL